MQEVLSTFSFFPPYGITSKKRTFKYSKNMGVLNIAIMECLENAQKRRRGYELQKKEKSKRKQEEKLKECST